MNKNLKKLLKWEEEFEKDKSQLIDSEFKKKWPNYKMYGNTLQASELDGWLFSAMGYIRAKFKSALETYDYSKDAEEIQSFIEWLNAEYENREDETDFDSPYYSKNVSYDLTREENLIKSAELIYSLVVFADYYWSILIKFNWGYTQEMFDDMSKDMKEYMMGMGYFVMDKFKEEFGKNLTKTKEFFLGMWNEEALEGGEY